MKMKLLILSCCLSFGLASAQAQCPETFHDFSALDIYGDTLHMEAFSEQPQHIKIQLWSLTGQLLSSLFDGTVIGNMQIQQPLTSAAPGIYFVEVSGNDWQIHRKILIQ